MTQTHEEQVLVVPRAVFERVGVFQGFSADTAAYLPHLLDPRHTCPNSLECFCPGHFLLTGRWLTRLAPMPSRVSKDAFTNGPPGPDAATASARRAPARRGPVGEDEVRGF